MTEIAGRKKSKRVKHYVVVAMLVAVTVVLVVVALVQVPSRRSSRPSRRFIFTTTSWQNERRKNERSTRALRAVGAARAPNVCLVSRNQIVHITVLPT